MIISTLNGKLKGFCNEDGIFQFLGIPYAAPPIGPLRFKPTEPILPWEGVKDATRLGHAAPQLYVPGLSSLKEEETLSENCLTLSVTTPTIEGNHPVLFWIHGGAFQKGSGSMGINPIAFAKEGITVVTVNYRLGVLGFLDVSQYLGDEYAQSGNNGLLDIVEALTWVKKNIAFFGGDPNRVTIMGQSAGAKIVSTLTIMEKANGLFQQAISCSGGLQCLRDQHTAQQVAEIFMHDAQITHENKEKLLTMDWKEILNAQTSLFAGLNLHTVGPVFDGITFKGNQILSLVKPSDTPLRILLGTNRDEMNLYWDVYKVHDMDESLAHRLFGNRAPLVLDAYQNIPHDDHFQENFVHFMTEWIYRAGTITMAEKEASVGNIPYLYRLDWDRQRLKACHGSETQFIMGEGFIIKDMDNSPAHDLLTKQMRNSFISFIKTGVPKEETLPSWTPFDLENRSMMIFDATSRIEKAPLSQLPPTMPYQVFALD